MQFDAKISRYDFAIVGTLSGLNRSDRIVSSLLDSSFEYAMEMLSSHVLPPADKRFLQILLFPVEFKASVGDFIWALNQLVYHLCSILYQRQALGFPDRPVFGGSVAKNGFRLYVAEWKRLDEQEPIIEVRHQRSYSLKNANEVYDCMVLIRRLVKVAIQALQTDYQQLPTTTRLKQSLETHRWRCFRSPECNDELQGIEGRQLDVKSRAPGVVEDLLRVSVVEVARRERNQ